MHLERNALKYLLLAIPLYAFSPVDEELFQPRCLLGGKTKGLLNVLNFENDFGVFIGNHYITSANLGLCFLNT